MVKVISLSDEAYKKLRGSSSKREGKGIMKAFGILNNKDVIRSLERSYKNRYKLKLKEVKF